MARGNRLHQHHSRSTGAYGDTYTDKHAGSQPVPPPAREPGAPHLFTGTVTLNGATAPEGTVVTAWVADFSEPVATATVKDGQYIVSVFQFGKRSFAGKTITFKIGGMPAQQTGSWESFGAEALNLTAGG